MMLAALAPLSTAHADEKSDATVRRTKDGLFAKVVGKHWLGIHAVPVDDALKAQLGLKDRLIVNHVVPESPAATAGLERHDILLKLDNREITNLDELMQAVADLGEQEARMTVLRGGKEVTLSVKAGERPNEEKLGPILPRFEFDDKNNVLILRGRRQDVDLGKEFIWRAIGPGIMSAATDAHAQFPDGLSISVSKQKDQPAKVTVQRDGKTYETSTRQPRKIWMCSLKKLVPSSKKCWTRTMPRC
jgi:hypothetical protein